jgi:hypothetical protein
MRSPGLLGADGIVTEADLVADLVEQFHVRFPPFSIRCVGQQDGCSLWAVYACVLHMAGIMNWRSKGVNKIVNDSSFPRESAKAENRKQKWGGRRGKS